MRFLADESCDFAIVRALRDAGHDVLAVREVMRGAEDAAVIDLAVRERRILLTEDKDFGQLVFASGRPSSGVVLLRYPPSARAMIVQDVLKLAEQKGQQLSLSFVVVKPGRIRLGFRLFTFRRGEIWIAALKGKKRPPSQAGVPSVAAGPMANL